MNIMNDTYTELRNAKMIKSGRQFSSTYVLRNANWFAYQKHNGRDFSLASAIDCLRSVRKQLGREAALSDVQTRALRTIEDRLSEFVQAITGLKLISGTSSTSTVL
jgi:hypothetical protein